MRLMVVCVFSFCFHCTFGSSCGVVCHHCSLLTVAPQLAVVMAQRESRVWLKSFWTGVLPALLPEVCFLWLSGESWKHTHTKTLGSRQALRRCLPLSQFSAIRQQTNKLLWNLSEVVPGSRSSNRPAIRRGLSQKPFQKGQNICLPVFWVILNRH